MAVIIIRKTFLFTTVIITTDNAMPYKKTVLFGDIAKAAAGAIINGIRIYGRYVSNYFTERCLAEVNRHTSVSERDIMIHKLQRLNGIIFCNYNDGLYPESCYFISGFERLYCLGYKIVQI